MADAAFASSEHLALQRRRWAERIGYDDQLIWFRYLVEIDQLVEALHRDQLDYPHFAAQLVIHPGFYAPPGGRLGFGDVPAVPRPAGARR